MGIGDILSQQITKTKEDKWDYLRTLRMSFTGMVLMGPCLYFWHKGLEKYCRFEGTKGALQKLALDQFLYAPTMLCSVLILLGNLEGKDWKHIKHSISLGYFTILKTNYLFWPFVNFANFRFIPYIYRTVFINCAGICWSVYLSDFRNRHFNFDEAQHSGVIIEDDYHIHDLIDEIIEDHYHHEPREGF